MLCPVPGLPDRADRPGSGPKRPGGGPSGGVGSRSGTLAFPPARTQIRDGSAGPASGPSGTPVTGDRAAWSPLASALDVACLRRCPRRPVPSPPLPRRPASRSPVSSSASAGSSSTSPVRTRVGDAWLVDLPGTRALDAYGAGDLSRIARPGAGRCAGAGEAAQDRVSQDGRVRQREGVGEARRGRHLALLEEPSAPGEVTGVQRPDGGRRPRPAKWSSETARPPGRPALAQQARVRVRDRQTPVPIVMCFLTVRSSGVYLLPSLPSRLVSWRITGLCAKPGSRFQQVPAPGDDGPRDRAVGGRHRRSPAPSTIGPRFAHEGHPLSKVGAQWLSDPTPSIRTCPTPRGPSGRRCWWPSAPRRSRSLYEDIPDALRLHRPLDLPEPFTAEADLIRHVDGILARNRTAADNLSFLGAGCARHFVPAVCDEINSPRRVPDGLLGSRLRGARPLPGAVRVPEHDGRAARDGRRHRPDVRRVPGRRRPASAWPPGLTGRHRVLVSAHVPADMRLEARRLPKSDIETVVHRSTTWLSTEAWELDLERV